MCPHAQTTTLSWLYGEAPDTHAAHVASCPDCAAVARDHAEVASAVGPVLGSLRPAAPTLPTARRGPRLVWAVMPALLAASALVAVALWPDPPPPPLLADTDVPAHVAAPDPLEAELIDLESEVMDLELELL